MTQVFDEAFAYLLQNEGLIYTNDPTDSGGPTKYGITQKAYENWIGRRVTIDEMKNLSIETAKSFYLSQYWTPMGCSRVKEDAIAICLFDSSILYGVGTASILVQRTLNVAGAALKLDGILGDKSFAVLNVVRPEDFLKTFNSLILGRIDAIIANSPKDEKYRNGWTRRANRLLTLAMPKPVNSSES